MQPETSQTIHDEKWNQRIATIEAIIRITAKVICILAALFILVPAVSTIIYQGVR